MKTEKKFRNSFDEVRNTPEVNELPSMTVPNMTLSLKELLTKYVRGGEVATFTPVYQDHDDFDEMPDLQKLDPMEKLDLAREIRKDIAAQQAEMSKPKPEPKPEPKPDPQPKTDPPATPAP